MFGTLGIKNKAAGTQAIIQPKLEINQPGDRYEQEADAMADSIMRMPAAHTRSKPTTGLIGKSVQRECAHCEEEGKKKLMRKIDGAGYGVQASPSLVSSIGASQGGGSPLPHSTRHFMENAFSTDFSRVRVHTDGKASEMSRDINAKAFTTGSDIYFKSGEYNPDTSKGSHLLAHELTHVVQQEGRSSNAIQRAIELRPPGRGEASAFDRAQELIDRLNRLSTAIEYRLESHSLLYIVVDRDTMTNFDTQLTGFIDQTVMVPLRLVPSTTEVKGDMFWEGYVDLDDLMASDDLGFQSLMLHFLAERFNVNRYAHRIGTDDLSPINLTTLRPNPEFTRAHEVGHQAQVAHFREVFSDPSIEFNYEEGKPSGDAHLVFKSHTGHYRIFVVMHKAVRTATSRVRATSEATVMVMTSDGQWHTVEDFLQMRAAAAAPVVQPKLEINQPGDRYEQEADAMADNVMRLPAANTQVKPVTGLIAKSVQRKCIECEEEEKKKLMRKTEGPGYGIQASPSLVSSLNASSVGGSPLPVATRGFMENAFSADFSRVRVHSDSKASEMSRDINARAFTTGSDIYFKGGEYNPDSSEGRHLLAHELAHVVQQGELSAIKCKIQRRESSPKKPKALPTQVYNIEASAGGLITFFGSLGNLVGRVETDISPGIYPARFDSKQGALLLKGADPKSHFNVYLFNPEVDRPILRAYLTSLETDIVDVYLDPPKTDTIDTKPSYIEKELVESANDPTLNEEGADNLISKFTSWANLDEKALGIYLLETVLKGEFNTIIPVLNKLGSTDRDDVSEEFMLAITVPDLNRIAASEKGKTILYRLYDELSSGHPDEEESKQAERILKAIAQRVDPEKFVEADEKAIIIPFSSIGFTKFSSASISAYISDNGKIVVRSHLQADQVKDSRGLELGKIWLGTLELDPQEVVGLLLYDEGNKIIYVPALYIIQLSNKETSKAIQLGATAFGTGLTLGFGGAAVATTETTSTSLLARAGTVLIWTDRVASVLSVTSILIDDHRGFIITTFGDDGERFLKAWSKVDRVLAIYGVARGVVALGQASVALRTAVGNMRTASRLKKLAAEESAVTENILTNTEKTLDEIEQAKKVAAQQNPEPQSGVSEAQADNVVSLDEFRAKKLAEERAKATVRVRQRKLAAGAENDGPSAKFTDTEEEFAEHIQGEQDKFGGNRVDEDDPVANSRTRHQRVSELDPNQGDSQLLGNNLRAAGFEKPGAHYEAHHMVPSGEPKAAELQDLLRKKGIPINDADNGVWLPRDNRSGNLGGEYKHEFTFDTEALGSEYFDLLKTILIKEPPLGAASIRLKLRNIRSFLSNGKLPPPTL
jgi:hypothetical protein